MERQTVSIMKACEMVGVSRRTIYNWIAANKVEYLRTAGGSIRIFVDTLWREPDGTKHPTSPNAAAQKQSTVTAVDAYTPNEHRGPQGPPAQAQ